MYRSAYISRTRILAGSCVAYMMLGAVCASMPRQRTSGNIETLTDQCDQGNYASCFSLGTKYMTGIDVPKDVARAAKLYQRACDHGNAKGCSALGYFYEIGLAVPQDMDRAVALCKRGCDRGDGLGCSMLAAMYETGDGVPKDMTIAFGLYQRGCDEGNAMSCSQLGRMYYYGRGVATDEGRAANLYQRACDGGAPTGCMSLGAAYAVGIGVARDEPRAAALYQRACDASQSEACATLGAAYEQGTGVTRDVAHAAQLYQRACDLGLKTACDNGDLARTLPKTTAAAAIEMLTDAEGVDFRPFVQSVYQSVKREWFSAMAPSIQKGNKGIVTIQFRVQQDGKVLDDFLKVVSNSGEKEFEYAARNAIRNTRPFDHLPGNFPQPFVELRMIFYYNTPPPKAQ